MEKEYLSHTQSGDEVIVTFSITTDAGEGIRQEFYTSLSEAEEATGLLLQEEQNT